MCGISGYISDKKIPGKLYYISHQKMSHRGPDDEGFIFIDNGDLSLAFGDNTVPELKNSIHIKETQSNFYLGHSRLSIIDLTPRGHQPMGFKDIWITYNGEIYNYIELRKELEDQGYEFFSDTDTEVILKMIYQYGLKAFEKFNGMWAMAIYLRNKSKLILARDRFGIKPLYFSKFQNRKGIVFASEIKFILDFIENIQEEPEIVVSYLLKNYIDFTDQTIFRNINEVPPGNILIYDIDSDRIEKQVYYDLSKKIMIFPITNEKIAKEKLKESFIKSLKYRLRSDVPVGTLLSGGIDSSTIVGVLKKIFKISPKTFTIDFSEEQYSEVNYVKKTTDFLGLENHQVRYSLDELIEDLQKLIYVQEIPFRSFSVYSQFRIYKYISTFSDVKVILNGQGADEIFAGYSSLYIAYLASLIQKRRFYEFLKEAKSFSKNRRIRIHKVLLSAFYMWLSRFINISILVKQIVKKYGFVEKDLLISTLNNLSEKQRQLCDTTSDIFIFNLLKNVIISPLREYLRYEDKNSMAFSIEVRVPFLDHELVELSFNISNSLKLREGINKWILREAFKDYLHPDVYRRREKCGFVSPQVVWQKDPQFIRIASDVFENIRSGKFFDYFNGKKLHKFYDDYLKGYHNDWPLIWRIVNLYIWKDMFLDKGLFQSWSEKSYV